MTYTQLLDYAIGDLGIKPDEFGRLTPANFVRLSYYHKNQEEKAWNRMRSLIRQMHGVATGVYPELSELIYLETIDGKAKNEIPEISESESKDLADKYFRMFNQN